MAKQQFSERAAFAAFIVGIITITLTVLLAQ